MSYAAFGDIPDGCAVNVAPTGWIPPAALGGCLIAFGAQQQACTQLAQQVMSSASQPYWGLPFAQPSEAQLFNWILNYGRVAQTKAQECALNVSGDMLMFDGNAWTSWLQTVCATSQDSQTQQTCAVTVATLQKYSVPFAQWVQAAGARSAGVVLASRPLKTDPVSGAATWDILSADFVAPVADDTLPLSQMGISLSDEQQQGLRTFMSAYKAILAAREGKFGPPRELFVVYAPAIANMGQSLYGIGDETIEIPPVPKFEISYPDGQGGTVVIGTENPPDPQQPPAGAPDLKKPGEPPEEAMKWVQFVAAGLGILVAVGTLNMMFKKKGT